MKRIGQLWVAVMMTVLAGWVSACAGTADRMDKGDAMAKDPGMMAQEKSAMDMEKEMTAMLTGSDGHHASGKVSFGMGMGDTHVLTLSDIEVDKVPDGYVYLAKDGDWKNGAELGMLKQFTGTVSFDLPAGVDPGAYDSVVIWCRKFNVEIGRADYGKKMM